MLQMLRGGDLRGRSRALSEGESSRRMAMVHAGLESGVFDALGSGRRTTEALASQPGATDRALLEAFLRVLESSGLVRAVPPDSWALDKRLHRSLEDDVVRAMYEAFAGFHSGLYRDLPAQLCGGEPRNDGTEQAAVIAEAGLHADGVERLTPGEPLVAVRAQRRTS